MYNKKSKLSAVLTIVTAILLIGLMIMLPFLQYKTADDSEDLSGLIVVVVIIYGFPLVYGSSIPFAIVALIFGIKMLKQQSRKKLISFNTRMLITTCVLLPFLAIGLYISAALIFNSTFGLFPIIYFVVTALAYIADLIAQICTIVALKKSPEETALTVE